jgi:leucyl aminopeptidase
LLLSLAAKESRKTIRKLCSPYNNIMIQFSISPATSGQPTLHLIDNADNLDPLQLGSEEAAYVREAIGREQNTITINRYSNLHYIFFLKPKKEEAATRDTIRKSGAEAGNILKGIKAIGAQVVNHTGIPEAALLFGQGLALGAYQFLKYRKEREKLQHPLQAVSFAEGSISAEELKNLQVIADAAYRARDLVNEPLNALGAVQLSEAIKALGEEAGFSVQVMDKAFMEKEGMGGILAVNRGSQDPPTYSIMEYKPVESKNEKPIVLVGKGVVYDTGGLSLKPTPNSMDRMKSDMSGAALVSAAMYAIAKLALPLHVIALVPSTDNRPGENAYVPGDVITMYGGTTVEVLNTDAEGRLLLGDALHWAKRYNPELVIDFATLTGAASVAVGEHGIVCMGTASEEVKAGFRAAGERQHERLVEYPLWDEYGDQIKSEIADLKNVGGPSGGAITAGKFLLHFIDYPWMHFDIAGVSFATAKKGYLPIGGTAYGLRMLMDFLMSR